MKDLIFDIQRFCVYDGPGIRTTVFFKGCNMRCAWCHNPESFSVERELLYDREKCVSCGACGVCPNGAHTFTDEGKHVFDRSKCGACGLCAEACLNQALEISGREYTADEVLKVIEKDAKYYKTSGGGVTFSGGEASMHFDFLVALLTACREKGIHTAIETNGLISKAHLEVLIPITDLFLLDCKLTNDEDHRKWTGTSIAPVMGTLDALEAAGSEVVLRCPIIPGINDTDAHFEAICRIRDRYSCVKKVEIMAYHDIGKAKWEKLGLDYSLKELKTVSPETKKLWEARISAGTQ